MNKNLKKTVALSMSAVMCFSMAACGKSKDKSKTNEESGSEYGYNVEYTTLSQNANYPEQLIISGDNLYYSTYTWDENTGASTALIQSVSLSGDKEPVTYTTYENSASEGTSISCLNTTDDGNITFLKTKYTYSDDGSMEAKDGENTSLDIGDVSKSDMITEDYLTQFGVDLNALGLSFSDISDLTVGEFVDLYNNLNGSSGNAGNEGTSEVYFITLDSDGKEISSKDLTAELGEDSYFSSYAVDKDGNYYMVAQVWDQDMMEGEISYKMMILSPESGSFEQFDIDESADYIASTGNGTILATTYDDDGNPALVEFDAAKKQFKDKKYSLSSYYVEQLYKGSDDSVYYTCNGSLYSFNLSDGKDKKIMDFLDYNISNDGIRLISYKDETHLSILSIETTEAESTLTLIDLTRVAASEIKQKTIITLGCLYLDDSVKNAILDFNKTSTEYQIKTKAYIDDNTEYDEAITNLNNDLTSGDAPDLIDCSSIEYLKYADKGLFEDLSSYMSSDSDFAKKNLNTHVLDLFKQDGKLYMLPSTFSINFLASTKDLLGENAGRLLTLDKFAELTEANPEKEILEYADRDSMLTQLYQYNSAHFINYTDGTCNFTDGEFEKILTIANKFISSEDMDYEDTETTPTKLSNGNLLFYQGSLVDCDQYILAQKLLSNNCNITGYPCVSGGSGLSVSPAGAMFAINSGTKYKEQCWDFVKTLFTSALESGNYYSGLPMDNDKLDEILKQAATQNTYTDENGNEINSNSTYSWDDVEIELTPLTDEDVAAIKDMINAADSVTMPYSTSDITEIISEEAQSFFNGEKSAADVCTIIQSRAEILINESK